MSVYLFKELAALATGAKARRDAAYAEFLVFYRSLVETLSADAVDMFGNMDVSVIERGKRKDFGLLLTAADFIFWKRHIEDGHTLFVEGPETIQSKMIERMAERAETFKLTPEERKRILDLLA